MRQRNKRRRFREIKKELREWLHFFLCLLTALIIAVFLRIYVYEFVQVKGNSMTPTLINKEFVFIEKINADKPERGEILIVRFPEDENYYMSHDFNKNENMQLLSLAISYHTSFQQYILYVE